MPPFSRGGGHKNINIILYIYINLYITDLLYDVDVYFERDEHASKHCLRYDLEVAQLDFQLHDCFFVSSTQLDLNKYCGI